MAVRSNRRQLPKLNESRRGFQFRCKLNVGRRSARRGGRDPNNIFWG